MSIKVRALGPNVSGGTRYAQFLARIAQFRRESVSIRLDGVALSRTHADISGALGAR